ncbi:MAG: hypothetical protein KDD53_07515 [Bdellovibrionales bacterium]|nr:hypothetical protein [Bdellovibrionales bacterium]
MKMCSKKFFAYLSLGFAVTIFSMTYAAITARADGMTDEELKEATSQAFLPVQDVSATSDVVQIVQPVKRTLEEEEAWLETMEEKMLEDMIAGEGAKAQ